MKRVPQEWLEAAYLDPENVLLAMRRLEFSPWRKSLPYSVATLRGNSFKPEREILHGALFCYGMGQRMGAKVMFARIEEQDYDIVATYQHDGKQCFVTIQLKELVPDDMPVRYKPCSLQEEIAKLDGTYGDPQGLIVAFYVNRRMTLEVDKLSLPVRKFSELWLFGAADAFQSKCFLIGNLLTGGSVTEFRYPGFDPVSFRGYSIRFHQ